MTTKKGLGRGLSALIPDADMEFLSRVARGEAMLESSEPRTAVANKPTNRNKPERTAKPARLANQSASPAEDVAIVAASANDVAQSTETAPDSLIEWVNTDAIQPNPYQPRRFFNSQEMEELASSIKEHGVLQPILLRPLENYTSPDGANAPRYQLVAGERRWRASQAAGLKQVPAIVRAVADRQALELALIENLQRHDISALDMALAYRRLAQEFSLSQDDVARRVGKSRSAIANTLRLLDLPPEIQKAIEEGVLSEGHGRAILLAAGDGARRAVFRRVLREKLSVRDTEQMARQSLDDGADEDGEAKGAEAQGQKKGRQAVLSPHIRQLEAKLQKSLGTRVRLKPRTKGGQIVIQYFSEDELERLLELLQK